MADKKQIGLFTLIMMIFTTVFGFANSTVAFYQMGYASIFWYILAAIIFFLPIAMMIAEYGSALPKAEGGIYSWLEAGLGKKFAFIGTFIWMASWIVWMVSTSSKVWIPFSTLIFGSDKTLTWSLFGLTPTQFVGILAVIWIIFVTVTASQGVDWIAKIGSIGGTMVTILTALFVVVSVITWIAQKGVVLQPIHGVSSFFKSPNPNFTSNVALLSFAIYAIFAYGGMESIGPMVKNIKNPRKTFPQGILIAMAVITVMYALMIFLWGVSTNWQQVLSGKNVTLGNITYVMMKNTGEVMGNALGLSHASSVMIGDILTRFAGLGMLLGYIGSFFVMVYSPVKALILGSDKRLWGKKMVKLNKHGMPSFAMGVQCAIIVVIILAIAFGGSGAQKFYQILTNMANVSNSAPYLFIAAAFPAFKRRADLNRPFVVFKSQASARTVSILVFAVVAFGIIFTCLSPILEGDWQTAFWTIFGPIFFGLVAWIFYHVQIKRNHIEEK